MGDLQCSIDGKTGAVTVAQTMRNGIALIEPIKIEITADAWLEVACALIMAGVKGRRLLNAQQLANGRVTG